MEKRKNREKRWKGKEEKIEKRKRDKEEGEKEGGERGGREGETSKMACSTGNRKRTIER